MKRSRFADTLLPQVAHGLNVGGLAVPSVEVEVTKDGEPCNAHLTMVKGRNTNLRWLETALNLKIRSLISESWPLLEDIDTAIQAAFGKRTRYSARNTVEGKHLPTSALFSVQARGVALSIHAPRRDLIYVDTTKEVISRILEQTDLDLQDSSKEPALPVLADAPQEHAPQEDASEESAGEDARQADPIFRMKANEDTAILAILTEVKAVLHAGESVRRQPSRRSFKVNLKDQKTEVLVANLNKARKLGTADLALEVARSSMMTLIAGLRANTT